MGRGTLYCHYSACQGPVLINCWLITSWLTTYPITSPPLTILVKMRLINMLVNSKSLITSWLSSAHLARQNHVRGDNLPQTVACAGSETCVKSTSVSSAFDVAVVKEAYQHDRNGRRKSVSGKTTEQTNCYDCLCQSMCP